MNSSTGTLAKIIKCVFPIDRRRVSNYVTALRAAKEQNIPGESLASWLEQQGGLQEISLRGSASSKPYSGSATEAKEMVLQQPVLASLTDARLTAMYRSETQEVIVLLLASLNPAGQFEIREVIQSEGLIKAALNGCYRKASAQKQKQNTAQRAVDQQKRTLDAVDVVGMKLRITPLDGR